MDREILEDRLSELPILQYEFIKTKELMFSENVRSICESECPMYGKTWACPPGVGSVSECKARCLGFEDALLLTTMAEVNDIANIEETLATRPEHEAITRAACNMLKEQCQETFVLSSEACTHCKECTYPDAPCRMPTEMFPCTESHAIVVTDIAEKYGIEFISGNIVTWFSIIFYR